MLLPLFFLFLFLFWGRGGSIIEEKRGVGDYYIGLKIYICARFCGFWMHPILPHSGQGTHLPGFSAAWRASFAIHVFGRHSELDGPQKQAEYIVSRIKKRKRWRKQPAQQNASGCTSSGIQTQQFQLASQNKSQLKRIFFVFNERQEVLQPCHFCLLEPNFFIFS